MSRDYVPISDKCRGRWKSILGQLGVDKKLLSGKHQPCPMCGGVDRFRWTDKDGSGAYYCSGCGHGSGTSLVMALFGLSVQEASKRIEAVLGGATEEIKPERSLSDCRKAMKALWDRSVPIQKGDPVDTYLHNRRIDLPKYPISLRYCPEVWHSDKSRKYDCMLAKIQDDKCKSVNIHRTYIEDGHKLEGVEAKKIMEGSIPPGSAIRLFAAKEVLGISEGIETALSAGLKFKMPVWSLITAGNMEKFLPPHQVKKLVVFGDCDKSFTGQASSYIVARNVWLYCQKMKREIEIDVKIYPEVGKDWNDDE